jgi:hypothetical protein
MCTIGSTPVICIAHTGGLTNMSKLNGPLLMCRGQGFFYWRIPPDLAEKLLLWKIAWRKNCYMCEFPPAEGRRITIT